MASAAVLMVNGGEISGGSLSGSGTMDSAAGSSSTLDGVTIAAGASFAAGANSILTLDHVIVAGAIGGGGSAGLAFGVAGSDAMSNISGFPTISLADGGKNSLTLKTANFARVTDGASPSMTATAAPPSRRRAFPRWTGSSSMPAAASTS